MERERNTPKDLAAIIDEDGDKTKALLVTRILTEPNQEGSEGELDYIDIDFIHTSADDTMLPLVIINQIGALIPRIAASSYRDNFATSLRNLADSLSPRAAMVRDIFSPKTVSVKPKTTKPHKRKSKAHD